MFWQVDGRVINRFSYFEIKDQNFYNAHLASKIANEKPLRKIRNGLTDSCETIDGD